MRTLETLLIAALSGTLFFYLHVPLPWLLGSLTGVLLWNVIVKRRVSWPAQYCYAGLSLVGYAIGCTFTAETGYQILTQLPILLVFTLAITLFSAWQGYNTHKNTGINLTSGLLGSMPGGLSQMAVLCEEFAGADITVVTLMQTFRQLAVVFVVPFLVIHGLGTEQTATSSVIATADSSHLSLGYLFLIGSVVIASGLIGRYLKLPTPFLLGPVLGTAVWVLYGLPAPQPSRQWLNVAQICIGAYTGVRINLSNIKNWGKILPYTIASVIGLLTVSFIAAFLLAYFFHIPMITAFLSTAPGGIAEMALTAMMVHANMSVVVAFQLFRLLFILTIVPPLLKRLVQYVNEKSVG